VHICLRFDQIFVGAFLNLELVVGHRSADDIIWRFGQQVNEQPVPEFRRFPFSRAVRQSSSTSWTLNGQSVVGTNIH